MTPNIETVSGGETPSLGRLLVNIIDKPADTFRAIRERPGFLTWAVPLLISFLAFAVLIVVQTPYTIELARRQAEGQLATLPPEQAEAARQSMAFTLSFPFMLSTTLLSGLIALVIALLLQATFFYFGAMLLGGDDTTFGSMFTMSAWARLPLALGMLVQAGFIAVTQRFIQYPGLAFLVTTGDPLADAGNPMAALLSGVDLFWLWNLLLLTIGLTIVARLGRGKAITMTLIYTLCSLGITVLPALLFGGFGGN